MQLTLRTIRRAIRATSATLVLASAGCADSELARDGGPADGPDPRDAAMPMDARVPEDARVPNDARVAIDARVETDALVQGDGSILLAACPLDALVCTGRDHSADDDGGMPGGYFGRCCAKAMCYAPEPNAGCESAEVAQNEHFSFGSGDCNCGDVEGPYAQPEDAAAEAGECCYVVPVIGCTGRPLSTDRGHLLAPIVSGTEWIV
jgi:hypothetical protein